MNISAVTPTLSYPTRPLLASVARPQALALDTVQLQGAPPAPSADKKKMYRGIAWGGFGIEMVGGGLTLAGHGAIGLPLFIVGAAAIVYGEYKAQRS